MLLLFNARYWYTWITLNSTVEQCIVKVYVWKPLLRRLDDTLQWIHVSSRMFSLLEHDVFNVQYSSFLAGDCRMQCHPLRIQSNILSCVPCAMLISFSGDFHRITLHSIRSMVYSTWTVSLGRQVGLMEYWRML